MKHRRRVNLDRSNLHTRYGRAAASFGNGRRRGRRYPRRFK